jgi:hypothetical protein
MISTGQRMQFAERYASRWQWPPRVPQPRVDHSRPDFIFQVCCLNRRATPSGSAKQTSRFAFTHSLPQQGTARRRIHQPQSFPQLAGCAAVAFVGTTSRPPKWIKPQLTRLVDEAPAGSGWLHEIKYDGYRIHARIDGRDIKLLTRTGLDWSHRYRRTMRRLAP